MPVKIDQTDYTFWLHPVLLTWVFLVSLGAFAVLPTIALTLYCLGYLCSYGMLIAFHLIVFYLGMSLISQLNQRSHENNGCLILIIFGLTLSVMYNGNTYIVEYISPVFDFFIGYSKLVFSFYMRYHLWAWPWIATGFVLTFSAASLFLIVFLRITDWIPKLRGVRLICPHPDCFQEGKTFFQCPNCNAELEGLHSSVYGIFAPRCSVCGTHVPSSYLLGRNRLVSVCPECGRPQTAPGFARFPEATFIVAGAPRSGKTSFLVSSFLALQNLPSGRLRSKITFEPGLESLLEKQKGNFLHGVPCPSTADASRPGAITLTFQHLLSSRIVYFYDSNGLEFTNSFKIHTFTFYKNACGIFLVIDPFKERGFRNRVHAQMNNQEPVFSGTNNASAIVGALCNHLDAVFGFSSQQKCSIPVCVIVTKTDIKGAYEEILPDGFPDLTDSLSISRLTQHSRKVRQFLEECDMYNFLSILDMKFKTIGFFAVSSLGHSPDSPPGAPFKSHGVLAPFTWLLAQGANIHVID